MHYRARATVKASKQGVVHWNESHPGRFISDMHDNKSCDAMRYLTSVTDMAWVQLPEWSDSVRIISSIWFEINFTDWQEGLTVSSNLWLLVAFEISGI